MNDRDFMKLAIAEAKKSADEGGVPVGACLADAGVLVAKGHNRRQQKKTIILHGETDCLGNAGLYGNWSRCTLYTTLSPCMMCSGTIVQFRIPRVVIGDITNFGGNEEFLRERGVEVVVDEDIGLIQYFSAWKSIHEEIWNGDIGI
jgi:cytosine/creatinine deaminase